MSKPYTPPTAWVGVSPVERAAHLYRCFESWRVEEICQEEGIVEIDMAAGLQLAQYRRQQSETYREIHGLPEYGSKP